MSRLALKHALDSLPNFILFLWVHLSLPASLLIAAQTYQDGELTLGSLTRILIAFSCAGRSGSQQHKALIKRCYKQFARSSALASECGHQHVRVEHTKRIPQLYDIASDITESHRCTI
jgi:hypothetical protein